MDSEMEGLKLLSPIEQQAKLDEILREQASGKWDFAPIIGAPEAETKRQQEQHAAMVQGRVRLGIALTALLRRSNTGPGKVKATRSKKTVDIAAITSELLG